MTVDQGIRDFISFLGPILKSRLVPPGGTAGQVLTKVSGTDYDDAWQTPAAGGGGGDNTEVITARGWAVDLEQRLRMESQLMPSGGPLWVPGRYYGSSLASSSTTQAATNQRGYLTPIYFARPRMVDQIQCNVTTAGGSGVVRMGIYNSDPDTGFPTTVLIQPGTQSVTTTGVKTIGFTATQVWGLYWLCLNAQSGTFTAYTAATMSSITGVSGVASASAPNHMYRTVTTSPVGSLPDLTPETPANYTYASGNVPTVLLRAA